MGFGNLYCPLRIDEEPFPACEFVAIESSAFVDCGQPLGKEKDFLIFRDDDKNSCTIDITPLSTGHRAATVFRKAVDLFVFRGDSHLSAFRDKAPLSFPAHGGQSLAKNSRAFVFGLDKEFTGSSDKAPLTILFNGGGLIAEKKGFLVARFDDELAFAINKAPLAIFFDGGEKIRELQGFFVLGLDNKLTCAIDVAVASPPSLLWAEIYPRVGLGEARFSEKKKKRKKSYPDSWEPTNCFSLKSHKFVILSVGFLPSRKVQIESERGLELG